MLQAVIKSTTRPKLLLPEDARRRLLDGERPRERSWAVPVSTSTISTSATSRSELRVNGCSKLQVQTLTPHRTRQDYTTLPYPYRPPSSVFNQQHSPWLFLPTTSASAVSSIEPSPFSRLLNRDIRSSAYLASNPILLRPAIPPFRIHASRYVTYRLVVHKIKRVHRPISYRDSLLASSQELYPRGCLRLYKLSSATTRICVFIKLWLPTAHHV